MDRDLCEKFSKNQGKNPLTGRVIKIGGPTHARLVRFCAKHLRLPSGSVTRPKAPSPNRNSRNGDCEKFARDPTRNPRTGRSIKPNGPTHASLVRKCAGKGVAAPLISRPVPSKSPIPDVVLARILPCRKIGLRQMSGTCWFNSSLNGFILGTRSGKIFESLSRHDKTPLPTRFVGAGLFSCPRVITKSHVLSYVRRVVNDRFDRTPGGKYLKNHAANLAIRLGHTPERLAKGGGDPVRAMKSILAAVFESHTYKICASPFDVQKISDPRVIIATVASRPGLHYSFGLPLPVKEGDFVLDHVVMNVVYTRPDGSTMAHAVVGIACGRSMYIYDSNQMDLLKFDWLRSITINKGVELWNLLSRTGHYAGTFSHAVLPYACYIRKTVR